MPGRQSTGPLPLKKARAPRQKRKRALDAFALAEEEAAPTINARSSRLGELEGPGSPGRGNSPDDYESDDNEGDSRHSKRLRKGSASANDVEVEGGSDGEGNRWMTGRVASDDDSSLDSDEAMGASDEERFEGFAFRGSSSRKQGKARKSRKGEDDDVSLNEDDEESATSDAESEGFMAEAVDLADVLDRRDSASEAESESGSDQESVSQLSFSEEEVEDDETARNLSGLQRFVSSLDTKSTKSQAAKPDVDVHEGLVPTDEGLTSKKRLTMSEMLGRTSEDSAVRKALRSKKDKLAVPLAKRQQDRLERAAAYDQSKDTLKRWVETVAQNRRAEHLTFPLIDPKAASAKSNAHLSTLSTRSQKPSNALEASIQKILEESGLDATTSQDKQIQAFEELATNKMSIDEVRARRAQLRRTRELLFREEIKAKRIKKIKSKSYRRVHRKERERDAQREQDMMAEAGIEPDEDEVERLHRLRAEERISGKHRSSRWARAMKGSKRGAWDEDARAGMHEMARREEELKRRVEGREPDADSLGNSASDSDDGSSEDEETARAFRLKELKELQREDHASNGLHSLKFMQKAEAARKAQNEEDMERLRRELAGEETPEENSDEDNDAQIGRRIFGLAKKQDGTGNAAVTPEVRGEFEEPAEQDEFDKQAAAETEQDVEIITNSNNKKKNKHDARSHSTGKKPISSRQLAMESTTDSEQPQATDNPWLKISRKSHSTKHQSRTTDVKISTSAADIAMPSSAPSKAPVQGQAHQSSSSPAQQEKPTRPAPEAISTVQITTHRDTDSDTDSASPPPPTTTNEALIRQAFAADDVLAAETFAAEKAALAEEEAAAAAAAAGHVEEERMPGWGSWVGDGVAAPSSRSGKAKPRQQQDKQTGAARATGAAGAAGAAKAAASNPRVMISLKRDKRNAAYLATQLPHPFETRAQYERSLRLPVGPEWVTRQTFLSGTRPRVQVRPGEVISAMRKPVA